MSETRALNAALSGPVFHGAATRSALHASERHVERWAPEGPKANKSASMRSLGFADRVAAPWMAAAMESRGARMMAQPTSDRSTPGVSWVFPRPWFQDELDWMASARVRAEQQSSFLTTRGTYESARTSAGDVAMPMVSPDMVAPSMATYGMPAGFAGPSDEGYGQVHHGLRAYSPMVPFAAAAAAEVVAGAIGLAQQSGLTAVAGAAERSPILGALTMVAPSTIAPMRAALPNQLATMTSASAAAAPSPSTYAAPAPTPAATRAMIDAARAAMSRVDEVRATPTQMQSASQSATADTTAEAGQTAPVTNVPGETAAPSSASPAFEPSVSEMAIANAASTSPSISRAFRAVELLLAASSPSAPVAASPTTAAPAPVSTFEPSAGPRVAMPAGLGGLVTALDTQRTTTHPMARFAGTPAASPMMSALARAVDMPVTGAAARAPFATPFAAPTIGADTAAPVAREVPGFSPVWASPATALGAIASERARAVDHVAWSDRWLARMVGASPVALAALDVAQDRATGLTGDVRARDVASPEMTYLRPPMPAPALAAAIRSSAEIQPIDTRAPAARPVATAPRPTASPDRALRIDDNESVSDDVFAAIAAAAVAPPRARPPVARDQATPVEPRPAPEPRTLTPADVVRAGSRPTIADLLSIAPPPAPDAGLSPGLASSPMAPAMAAMLPMPAAPVFDTRALYPEALGTAYMGGMLSRSAAPIGVVSSTPTMSALMAAANATFSAADFAAAPRATAAPSGLPFVMLDRAQPMGNAAFADARAWSTRDLSIAPSSLRLAEAAPERVMLAAEQARRATSQTTVAPFAAAEAARVEAARTETARADAPFASPSTSHATPIAPSVEPSAVTAESPTTAPGEASGVTAPTTAAAAPQAMPFESDLVALRAALLAGPGATSLPLAFAEFLPMLSAAMSAPIAAAAPESAADTAPSSSIAPTSAALPSAAAAAAEGDRGFGLPFVTATATGLPGAMAAPAGARGLALPAVGGIPTMASPLASRFATDDGTPAGATSYASPTWRGVEGARDSLSSLVALQSPAAATSTGRPGSIAEMALSWAVAEERAVTDLSFDFVAPEMVLAAKVYGLSPGAAAQAARLAVAGPSAIASLAQSVDLTFLRGFQQVHAQQAAGTAPFARTARAAADAGTFTPGEAPSIEQPPGSISSTIGSPIGSIDAAAAYSASVGSAPSSTTAAATDADAFAAPPMPGAAGSVLTSPRLPRGAFLWPEATVAALGMKAMSPDGVAGMPVVALELLAAAAVADLGTWVTAFPSADQAMIANVIRGMGGTVPTMSTTPGPISSPLAAGAPSMTSLAAAPAGSPTAAATAASTAGISAPTGAEASDAADATPELASAPRDLRARFEAIYIALAQTGDGQNLSPSSRAARAMALLAREDGGATSARERALATWSMLPQVYQGGFDLIAPRDTTAADGTAPESRPGLAGLAARAGESLGSFVAPSAREVSSSSWSNSDDRRSSVADRIESPVYVNTAQESSSSSSPARAMARPGRAFAQAGGGEPEIPAWFEDAARRMLDQRGGASSGMSLAELVLVTTAATPSKSIAAATRGTSSTPAGSTPASAGTAAGPQNANIDKLAFEVYLEVLKLIDIARERGGDPYQ